jgi:hypothetical protein
MNSASNQMHIDTNNPGGPTITPANTPGPPDDGTAVHITLGMWNHLLQRITALDSMLESTTRDHETLRLQYEALAREYYEAKDTTASTTSHRQEPKIPDPPMFTGDRKELLPFLTKCQIKFEGQPSRFPDERSKILYVGSRLDGPAFAWFQPLIVQYPVGAIDPPEELQSFASFSRSITVVYGDPNLEATAVREMRRLHQTGSAAEYAAKFESKKQYMTWNDQAYRDQFYLNLKDELKDEIAPVGKPPTYRELKELAIRLDARLYERRLERTNATRSIFTTRTPLNRLPPATTPVALPPMTTVNPPTPTPTTNNLRVPSHTSDGTVPMELDSQGAWHLTPAEKERRRLFRLCAYCGEKSHEALRCPVAPPAKDPRLRQRAVMTFELAQPDNTELAEKASAQE